MSFNSVIGWTQATWNPVVGCTKHSEGCRHCYAVRHVWRMGGHPNSAIRRANGGLVGYNAGELDWSGEVRPLPDRLQYPHRWRKPRMVFVNSLSDLFHKDVPDEFIDKVFATMRSAHWHTYQVLTKRSDRLRKLSPMFSWRPNIWMGVTVESAKHASRIDDLRATGAQLKFLSLEPLLGPMPDLDLAGIDWVIVGGETGPGSRRMEAGWVRDVRDQCLAAGVPFYLKQWGEFNEMGERVGRLCAGSMLEAQDWTQMPVR